MSEKIVQLNEEIIKGQIKELVRGSVEETLNELLEKEAESLTQAARYERSEARQGYRSGHYDRNLTTTSGDVTLHMPRLKGVSFETAIIERYRRRESSVEEALIEMYLAGVSVMSSTRPAKSFSIGAEAPPAFSAVPYRIPSKCPDWHCRYAVWRNVPQLLSHACLCAGRLDAYSHFLSSGSWNRNALWHNFFSCRMLVVVTCRAAERSESAPV